MVWFWTGGGVATEGATPEGSVPRNAWVVDSGTLTEASIADVTTIPWWLGAGTTGRWLVKLGATAGAAVGGGPEVTFVGPLIVWKSMGNSRLLSSGMMFQWVNKEMNEFSKTDILDL